MLTSVSDQYSSQHRLQLQRHTAALIRTCEFFFLCVIFSKLFLCNSYIMCPYHCQCQPYYSHKVTSTSVRHPDPFPLSYLIAIFNTTSVCTEILHTLGLVPTEYYRSQLPSDSKHATPFLIYLIQTFSYAKLLIGHLEDSPGILKLGCNSVSFTIF